jgi:hypothetical protein
MNDPRYPDGKLNEEDDGAMDGAVFIENGTVVMSFAKAVTWIGMPPAQAVALATLLIRDARKIDPDVIVTLPRYQLRDNGKRIECLTCHSISSNPTDVATRYCGHCHVFLNDV